MFLRSEWSKIFTPKPLSKYHDALPMLQKIMRTTLQFIIILFASVSLWTTSAQANCLVFAQNERLSNYCLLNEVSGKLMDGQTASVVVQRLQREGYFGGISEPTWATKITPSVTYSNNINGGNPDKKLVLGNLEFDGDPNLVAKEGVIGSLNLSAINRVTFGEGDYITTSLLGTLSYSPEHDIDYSNVSANVCSKNKVDAEFYIDVCGSISHQHKQISDDRAKVLNVSLNHLTQAPKFGYFDLSIGAIRSIQDDYTQSQLKATIDIIHNNNRFGSLGVRKGEKVPNQLALDFGFDIQFSRILSGKKVDFRFAHEYQTGGKLFGIARTDKITSATASLPIREDLMANIGFVQSNSNINYFDQDYPIISLTHMW